MSRRRLLQRIDLVHVDVHVVLLDPAEELGHVALVFLARRDIHRQARPQEPDVFTREFPAMIITGILSGWSTVSEEGGILGQGV